MMFIIALLTLFASSHAHKCIHDQLKFKPRKTFVSYDNHPYDKTTNAKRRLLTYSPIRILPDFTVLESQWANNQMGITEVKRAIGAVVRYLEKTLRVVPVSGSLKFERPCARYYTGSNGQQLCSTIDSVQTCQSCGGTPMVTIPDSALNGQTLYNNQLQPIQTIASGPGIAATDIVIYVTARNCNCGGSTLAWAGSCRVDQYGRPVAGVVNICSIDTAQWADTVDTLLHEIGHILFMSSSLYPSYRDSAGNVRSGVIQVVNGREVMTTPEVKRVAQSHFQCSSLAGGPIENGGGTGSAGSHWDQQFMYTAIMTPAAASARQAWSEFSMAAMMDSGWYQVTMAEADPLAFGKNAGCNFITNPSSPNCGGFPDFYCTTTRDSCTFDGRETGGCGGANSYSPCNVIQGWSNRVPCADPTNTRTVHSASGGPTSRCTEVVDTGYNPSTSAACYPMTCNSYNAGTGLYSSVTMQVGQTAITCSRAQIGSTKTVSNSLTVTCPNFDAFCVGSSPFTCDHGHMLNGACYCSVGYTGSTCNVQDNAPFSPSPGQAAGPVPTTPTTKQPTRGDVATTRQPTPSITSGGGGSGGTACTGVRGTLGLYFRSSAAGCAEYELAMKRFQPCVQVVYSCNDIPYPGFSGYRKVTMEFQCSTAIWNGVTSTQWRQGMESALQAMGIQITAAAGGATPPPATGSAVAENTGASEPAKKNDPTGLVVGVVLGSVCLLALLCGCIYLGRKRQGQHVSEYQMMQEQNKNYQPPASAPMIE